MARDTKLLVECIGVLVNIAQLVLYIISYANN